jgi:hypothetical protein
MLKQAKSTISGHFFGIFYIFIGKVTPNQKIEKIYVLNILYTHQDKQLFFIENFPEMHILRDI